MASWPVLYSKLLLNFIFETNDNAILIGNRKRVVSYRLQVLKFCENVNLLISNKEIDEETIRSGLLAHAFDVNILWLLCSTGLINSGQYFEEHTKNGLSRENNLGEDIGELCLVLQKTPFEQQVCTDIVDYLDHFYCNTDNDFLLSGFATKCYSTVGQLAVLAADGITLLESLLKRYSKKFREAVYLHLMKVFILERGEHVLDVISCVEKYRPRSEVVYEKLCMLILSNVNSYECLLDMKAIIVETLDSGSLTNWNHISKFLLCAKTACKDFVSAFKNICCEIIEKALNDSNTTHIYVAFLLGRILTLEEMEVNLTYLQWYSSAFSSESSRPLNTVPRAKFFFKAMGDIIDLEPPYCLKAHIHKAFSVPASCQGDLAEYLQLAKARLLSMNESVEIGFFDNKFGGSAAVNDVQCLLKQFEVSGKLSSTFLAALTFRRQYFEKAFVPALFATCPGKRSTHHTVIKKLLELGKISKATYNKHEEGCSGLSA